MTTSQQYAHKTEDYFTQTQAEVAEFISGTGNRILDIGCGEGRTGAYLKQIGKASEVHGVELMPEIAQRARVRLDSVLCGNLESMELPFAGASFDAIIATEVLEHLIDPGALLRRLRPLLRPGGVMAVSTPNMRHIRVIYGLMVRGDWRYEDSGPLDRTHLRFFTRKSLRRLLDESGYTALMMKPVLLAKARVINTLTLGLMEELLAYRYYGVGRAGPP